MQIYLFQDYLVKLLDKELAYKVTWSTPHCVLTLKLIGITWDIYDSLGSQVTFPLSRAPFCPIIYI